MLWAYLQDDPAVCYSRRRSDAQDEGTTRLPDRAAGRVNELVADLEVMHPLQEHTDLPATYGQDGFLLFATLARG